MIGCLCGPGWINWAGIGYHTSACKLTGVELERGDSHKPATPACREKDLPSCIGDIILMVNLAR